MLSNKRSLFTYLLLVVVGSLLMACNDQSAPSSNTGSGGETFAEDSSDSVNLLKATPTDVVNYRVDCPSSKKKSKKEKICIQICHVPPGNPDNMKDKVLPLSAVVAHLKHGGPHHMHHDYLGLCEDVDDDTGDDGSGSDSDEGGDDSDMGDDDGHEDGSDCDENDDEGSGDGDEDGSDAGDERASDDGDDSSDGDEGMVIDPDAPETPTYCEMNFESDADCDGYDDQSGEDMYNPDNF